MHMHMHMYMYVDRHAWSLLRACAPASVPASHGNQRGGRGMPGGAGRRHVWAVVSSLRQGAAALAGAKRDAQVAQSKAAAAQVVRRVRRCCVGESLESVLVLVPARYLGWGWLCRLPAALRTRGAAEPRRAQ